MTYTEAVNWMFSQLPMYQRQGKVAFKKDLTNINAFIKELEYPHKKFKSIHVGGTNGKGSTSHMLASVLQESGYKTGLYTSPHLKEFTERIKVNGEEISKTKVTDFINKHKIFLKEQGLSFFEMTVGLAFWYFAEQEVDIAIVEVGLGGRLDSTNVIVPEVSVITNIGLDHTQFLGETLEEVATEKAGIIKKNVPVVIGEYQKETERVFLEKARKVKTNIYFASNEVQNYKTDLLGSYQKKNINTAVLSIKKLNNFAISEENVKKGLLNVVKNTNLKGRWEALQKENPKIICDTAHNKEGLTYALEQLQQEKFERLHIVLGVVSDKNIEEILPMFPKKAHYYFCSPDIPRGLPERVLQKKANKFNLKGESYVSVKQALIKAKKMAGIKDVIYIGGSTFVVAEVI